MLQQIQNELEQIYQIPLNQAVEEFLLPEIAPSCVKENPWILHSDEALVVEQSEAHLDVGLWLSPDLLSWSQQNDLDDLSQQSNLMLVQKLGPLIEGVSHFMYLLWKAEKNVNVTQLEMELQAEVDKFVLLRKLFEEIPSGDLMNALFEDVKWNPVLEEKEQERYVTAVKLASQYCDYLRINHKMSDSEGILPELRSFYRMNQAEKIRHIS